MQFYFASKILLHEGQRAWTEPKIPLLGVKQKDTSWRSVRISDCLKEKKAAKRKCEYRFVSKAVALMLLINLVLRICHYDVRLHGYLEITSTTLMEESSLVL